MTPVLAPATTPRWVLRRPDAHLAGIPKFPRLVATVLAARGITTRAQADLFYKPHLQPAYDPLLLPGMREAVARTRRAIRDGELVALYGDFDVDGVTSVAVLELGMRPFGAKTLPYIPDRFREGYGLNMAAIDQLRLQGVTLLITADCGISSVAEVDHANRLGIDVIILDHHTVPERMPAALAAVNPKRSDSPYPFDELAAVGVAYRFLQVLAESFGRPLDDSEFVDLVALGTVVDVAPLHDENRRLVVDGIARMQQALRPGLEALCRVAKVEPSKLGAETLGFALGPRMNAAGRLKHANIALDLMLADDAVQARILAEQLDELNRQRQQQTQDACALATELCGEADAPLIMVGSDQIHSGIVGIVAGRLVEQFHRPAIVFEQGPEFSRASARSIPAFDIVRAIRKEQHLLERHGGHRAAAGFTVRTERVPELRDRLQNTAAELLAPSDLRPTFEIDAEAGLDELVPIELKGLLRFEPCGFGNRKPVLLSRGVQLVDKRQVGADGDHLKMTFRSGAVRWDAIAWRTLGEGLEGEVDIVYSIQQGWRGTLELEIHDIAPTAERRPLEAGTWPN